MSQSVTIINTTYNTNYLSYEPNSKAKALRYVFYYTGLRQSKISSRESFVAVTTESAPPL
jgi:hypothetical protein